MPFCKKCGTAITDSDDFCQNCGGKTKDSGKKGSENSYNPEKLTDEQLLSLKMKAGFLASGSTVLIIFGVIFFILSGSSNMPGLGFLGLLFVGGGIGIGYYAKLYKLKYQRRSGLIVHKDDEL